MTSWETTLAICDASSMEVLAEARNEQHLAQLRGLMARATLIPLITEDYDQAAALFVPPQWRNGSQTDRLFDRSGRNSGERFGASCGC
jgi:hypothetical protein